MIDPVTLAVVRGALEQIADEMDLASHPCGDLADHFWTNDCAHGIFQSRHRARRLRRGATACRCSSPTSFTVTNLIAARRKVALNPDNGTVNDPT